MLSKPSSCRGCPWYGDGRGFVPDKYVEGSSLCVVSQNPGADEEAGKKVVGYQGGQAIYEDHPHEPLLGATGYQLDHHYLPLTGLDRPEVSLANPIRCRKDHRNDVPDLTQDKVTRQVIERCQELYFRPPSSAKLFVAEGAYALYALTGEGLGERTSRKKNRTLEAWRGYVLPFNPPPRPMIEPTQIYLPQGRPSVLATYHLAFISRAPWMQPVAQRDWKKVGQVLMATWPQPLPPILNQSPTQWPNVSAFDTEFDSRGRLTRYSLAYRPRGHARRVVENIQLHVVEAQDLSVGIPIQPDSTVIMQNLDADLAYLNEIIGGMNVTVEDTMYAHAVLYPDLDHDLNFGGSLYSSLNRWKHLADVNPRIYSGGDAVGTLEWMEGMWSEFNRDSQSKWVYDNLQMPLWPIILKSRSRGIKVNIPQAKKAVDELSKKAEDAIQMAQAAVGWPINLGSPKQLGDWLFNVVKIHTDKYGRVWKR